MASPLLQAHKRWAQRSTPTVSITTYIPKILRLQAEIGSMFADAMDILSLTRWRLTCKTNYDQATSSFHRSLTTRLQRFVPFPHTLVDIVGDHRALFGGEVALSFLLRDDAYVSDTLEIFCSDFKFEALCSAILDSHPISTRVKHSSFSRHTFVYALRRLVSDTLELQMTNGKTIYVHQSYTPSPSAPITRLPCTALSNFVTGYGFGCSHPNLTLHRRALLADQELPYTRDFDTSTLEHLKAHGFSIEVSPAAWPEYRAAPPPRSLPPNTSTGTDEPPSDATAYTTPADSLIAQPTNAIPAHAVAAPSTDTEYAPSSEECWRHVYICPSQGRFFGDKGSFVDYFNPLAGDEDVCATKNIAPFGPMVVWRVLSSFDCDEGCEMYDDVLEEGVTSIPVLIRRDPYGEVRDLLLQRTSRHVVPGSVRSRRRARSL